MVMECKKDYWIVSREYAGLAEAGGVKNVVTSLATGLKKLSLNVTVLMPLYGCTAISYVDDFDIIEQADTEVTIGDTIYKIVYAQGYFKGVRIVFIVNSSFTSKMGVYTYTRLEEALYSDIKSGEGHTDASTLSLLFQKAVIEYGVITGECPNIFHCQDAHTAMIPFLVNSNTHTKDFYSNTKFFITIHNAGTVYRNQCESIKSASLLLHIKEDEFTDYSINGKPEPFLLSQKYASYTTVSPWYAEELLDPNNEFCGDISSEFYKRKFSITGITNGIDFESYNPAKKNISKLPFAYNPMEDDLAGKYECRKFFLQKYAKVHTCTEEKKLDRIFQYGVLSESSESSVDEKPVYFAFHGRLVHQKGIDILTEAAKLVLKKRENAHFIVIGQGTKEFENDNINLARQFPGKYIYFQGYDKPLSRLCIAVSDFLVLPSFFEPCGLEDFIGQIYGTIPVANSCGGLNKILHEKTGFLYKNNDAQTLSKVLIDLIDRKKNDDQVFNSIIKYGAQYVLDKYSWEKILKDAYIPLFL